MATRLYPNTKNPKNLEILAGVPEGTYQRLAEHKSKEKDMDENQWFETLMDDPNMDALHNFKVFGWGRMAAYLGPFGETTNPAKIAQLLCIQGVEADPNLTEGLHWS